MASRSRSCCWASRSPSGDDLVEWALADVLYGIVAGIAIGALLGYGIAALTVRLRDRELLARELDGWVAIGAVAVIYGATEVAGAYGFLAAFAGGIGFRRYEHTHERNRGVHDGAEIVEDVARARAHPRARLLRHLDRPRRARRERLGARAAVAPRHPPRRGAAEPRAHARVAARACVRRLVRRAWDRLAVLRVGGHRGRGVQRGGDADHLLDGRRGGHRLHRRARHQRIAADAPVAPAN